MTHTNFTRLFSTDLDGTLLNGGETLKIFAEMWNRIELEKRPQLCYNTGRLVEDVLQLIYSDLLPEPDYIIGGVGTAIFDYKANKPLKEFTEILDEGWDLAKIDGIFSNLPFEITKQPAHLQNAYKSSWYLADATEDDLNAIKEKLDTAGLDYHLIYSSSLHLDILPKWANKGNALSWLLKHLGIRPGETIVAGDTGNDTAMFQLRGVRGIIVGNAQPELRQATNGVDCYLAPEHEHATLAVINGLHYFGVFPTTDIAASDSWKPERLFKSVRYGVEEDFKGISAVEMEMIRFGYDKAIEALYKNITPLGFNACSAADNETVATDENYLSVWARDGAITILGSLPLSLKNPDVKNCQRQTLLTLLNHISPNGQIPANVRMSTQQPDYSGVGGISSIDSGLWVIIAFYAFVYKTQDYKLLRDKAGVLQQVMNWLSAHDSNNDGLIEIPEAGDWTDLFGRSYNVLYDEVLWYRANICFGRLLQMLGDERRGGDYLRWARIIKREIQLHFWPSTKPEHSIHAATFADRQFFLGDARYLIAQVTPFDFSWRCDTFANTMAFLYDVIDHRYASHSFRFMWGVGVNDPYPVANLYPVVTAGDREWRDYYTVNLLNLPHHYHNGGIWPFIGAFWVRFINKLGLAELARQELYRLALLCKLGIRNEWEFNEWVHGRTGRPMGKTFQAWSAAQYILTCHELKIKSD